MKFSKGDMVRVVEKPSSNMIGLRDMDVYGGRMVTITYGWMNGQSKVVDFVSGLNRFHTVS